MKFKNPMLVVKDLAMSKAFYGNVLGLHIIADFGANVTLTGGVCLQTEETWKEFIANEEIAYGGKDAELYFEEENFDAFLTELSKMKNRVRSPRFRAPLGTARGAVFRPRQTRDRGGGKHENGVPQIPRRRDDGGRSRRAYGRSRVLRAENE